MPGGAGDAAAEIEGLCYVLDHQAAWAALITFGPALDFQDRDSGASMRFVTMRQQLWGLQEVFSWLLVGLWGCSRSTRISPGVLTQHWMQLHFLLLAHDLNVSMFRLQAFQGTV